MTKRKRIDELRERVEKAKARYTETAKVSPNSFGAAYDLGYRDALEEFLEKQTVR